VRVLRRDVEIEASADRVWRVLTDFPAYPEWNPFITRIEGEPQVGARLEVRIEPPGGRAMTLRPRVVEAEPGSEFRWLGRFLAPGIFDGEHSFRIEPLSEGRVRLVQEESFRGALVGLVGGVLAKTERGFDAMNQALKARAEQA
jgi:hypothetical protein